MRFSEIFARADSQALAELAGSDTVRLLRALGDDYTRPARMGELILKLRSEAELLVAPTSRRVLLELLRPAESEELARELGVPAGSLASAKMRKPQLERLLAIFQLALPSPDPSEAAPLGARGVDPLAALFAHQRAALASLRQLLPLDRGGRALLHMPTGSGKTRTAMNLVADRLRAVEPATVLWLASTAELCEQAAEEFERTWATLGNRRFTVVRAWAGESADPRALDEAFIVTSVATARERWIRDAPWIATLGDRTSLVIFDEAHQAVAPWARDLLLGLLARRPDTALLGLSATPGRSWNEPERDAELARLFNRQKVTLAVQGHASPIEYLIREKYLARPVFSSARWRRSGPSDRQRAEIGEALEIPERVLEDLASEELRSLKIVQEVERLRRSHARVLVFASTVHHADLLATVLSSRGTSARSVTGATPTAARRASIEWYKSASLDTRVITNFGVLTTGFDAPKTSAAVIARPTKSLVLYSQMIGRALRGTRAGGNDAAEIVTLDDFDLPGFRDPHETFFNWEDVW